MNVIRGMFLGVGSSKTWIGLGGVAVKAKLAVIDQSDAEEIVWEDNMQRAVTAAEGIIRKSVANAPNFTVLTFGTGVAPYYGGDVVPAANTHYLVHKSCLVGVRTDSPNINYAGDMRGMPAGGGLIGKWTLDTAGTPSGHFDTYVDTTYVGVGSPVWIRPFFGTGYGPIIRTYITAITNGSTTYGQTADDVTLAAAVPSGLVAVIGYKYDFIPAPAGSVMPAGLVVNDYTYLNVSGQKNSIEAWIE
jgi:hypothetical protein